MRAPQDVRRWPQEERVEEEAMDLLKVLLGVADAGVSDQPPMLSWQHVDVNLLDLLFLVEVGHDCLGTQSDGLVGMDISTSH